MTTLTRPTEVADWMDDQSAEAAAALAREQGYEAEAQRDPITGYWGVRLVRARRPFYFDRSDLLMSWLANPPAGGGPLPKPKAQPQAPPPATFAGFTGWTAVTGGDWQLVKPVPDRSGPHSRAYVVPTVTLLTWPSSGNHWRLGLGVLTVQAMTEALGCKPAGVRLYADGSPARRFAVVPSVGGPDVVPLKTGRGAEKDGPRNCQLRGPEVDALVGVLDKAVVPEHSTIYPANAVVLPGLGRAWVVDLTDPARRGVRGAKRPRA